MNTASEKQQHLTETLKAALNKPLGTGGDLRLTAALTGRHPADIVGAMGGLKRPEILAVFNWLDNDRAAEVLDELDSETVRFLTDNAPPGRLAVLLDYLPMDDAAEIVSEAHPSHCRLAFGRSGASGTRRTPLRSNSSFPTRKSQRVAC